MVAYPPDPIVCEGRIFRTIDALAIRPHATFRDRQVAPARGEPVRPGQHKENAGGCARCLRVNRHNPRVGVRRTQHDGMHNSGQADVVDVAAGACDQRAVLDTLERRADVVTGQRIGRRHREGYLTNGGAAEPGCAAFL